MVYSEQAAERSFNRTVLVCESDLPPLENLPVFDEQRRRSSSQRVFSRGRPSQQRTQETRLDQHRPAEVTAETSETSEQSMSVIIQYMYTGY